MNKIKKRIKHFTPSVVHNFYKKIAIDRQFLSEFKSFKALSKKLPERFPVSWQDRMPCMSEKNGTTVFDRHYVYHLAWAARILSNTKPEKHIDISSYVYFPAVISAFIPVNYYEYHPCDLELSGLTSRHADLLSLPFEDGNVNSLSCMHVVEHVGLGRYGDPVDPDGDLKAIEELKRVMAGNGDLLFVVPVGQPKVIFNAHRIYSYDQVISYFTGFNLTEFSLIPDNPADGGLICNAPEHIVDQQEYGCGCFWFKKEKH